MLMERDWGHWQILAEKSPKIKIKELVIHPGGALSFQKHHKRNEHWFVLKGKFTLYLQDDLGRSERTYDEYDSVRIPMETWHQACNPFDEDCSILEVQYGEICEESDIERRNRNFL